MSTRYTPRPGQFFTVTKWLYGHTQISQDGVFILLEWKGPRLIVRNLNRAYSYEYSFDIRDVNLAPLFDEEVIRKLGGHEEKPKPVDAIGEFCVALAAFTAQLNTLSEALKKAGKDA